jgi:hypothetical protein
MGPSAIAEVLELTGLMRLLRLRRCPTRHGVAVRVCAMRVRDSIPRTGKGVWGCDEQSTHC